MSLTPLSYTVETEGLVVISVVVVNTGVKSKLVYISKLEVMLSCFIANKEL